MAILASLATLNSAILNLCPLFDDIPAIKRARTTGDRPATVLLAIWVNSLLWVDYSIFTHAFHPVGTTNLTGFFSGSYFLYVFHSYAPTIVRRQFTRAFVAAAVFVLLMYIYTASSINSYKATRERLGAICCIVTVALYASPLGNVIRAIQLKSNRNIPFFFALAGSSNSILWTGFGLLNADPWIYTPNLLGAIFSVFQLIVYLFYSTRHDGKSPTELNSVLLPNNSLSSSSIGSARRSSTDGGLSV